MRILLILLRRFLIIRECCLIFRIDSLATQHTGEGVEQATFSSYRETTAKDEADDSRTVNATSREDECFRTRVVFETSGDEGASMSKACLIKGDKKCEADMIEEIAMKKDIESEVAMDCQE